MLSRTLLGAAAAAAPVLAVYTPEVVSYWGQAGTLSLEEMCTGPNADTFDYLTIAFINVSPENGGLSGYPGSNFGAHCAAEVYVNGGHDSKLLSECSFIRAGIPICQAAGKKILISIGGVYNTVSNYRVTTEEAGEEFAEFMWDAFGPVQPGYTGPRPLDTIASPNPVDGFDFDIEYQFGEFKVY